MPSPSVVFDSLQIDELWTVDDVGYNFRHEITLDGTSAISRKPASSIRCDID